MPGPEEIIRRLEQAGITYCIISDWLDRFGLEESWTATGGLMVLTPTKPNTPMTE